MCKVFALISVDICIQTIITVNITWSSPPKVSLCPFINSSSLPSNSSSTSQFTTTDLLLFTSKGSKFHENKDLVFPYLILIPAVVSQAQWRDISPIPSFSHCENHGGKLTHYISSSGTKVLLTLYWDELVIELFPWCNINKHFFGSWKELTSPCQHTGLEVGRVIGRKGEDERESRSRMLHHMSFSWIHFILKC